MHLELHQIVAAFALLVGATGVGGLANRLKISAPILLVLVGLAVSFLPFVPDYELEPEIVLIFFLPPLLYSAAWKSSFVGFRQNIRPIALLSVGFVLFSTVVVGFVMYLLIPELPLAAAFALGAIVAPPDAVSATAIGRTLGLPRRTLTILGGESLVNDATALTLYRVAVAAVGGGVTFWQAGGTFLLAAGGGVAIGLVLGFALHWLRVRVTETVLESSIILFTPFIAYLAAESAHASGVLAVVVTGLYLGHRDNETTFATRLQNSSTWELIDFVLESLVFVLIGLQLPLVIRELADRNWAQIAWWSAAILVVTIVVRVPWVFFTTYAPRWLSKKLRERDPAPPWSVPTVISWTGMRGVVSLAAAFALATDFPARDLILFLTFVVVLGTLVIQGFSLPWVIRKVGLGGGGEDYGDRLAEANAQHRAARAAIERLDELVGGSEEIDGDTVSRLRGHAEYRSNGAWERIGEPDSENETPSALFRRLRQEMVRAERDVFVAMRNEGQLDDELLRQLTHELDLEEAMLTRRSER